jgi:hypothetical protein
MWQLPAPAAQWAGALLAQAKVPDAVPGLVSPSVAPDLPARSGASRGVSRRRAVRPRLDPEARGRLAARVVDLYRRGNSIRQVSETVGRSYSLVRALLLESGCPLREPHGGGWPAPGKGGHRMTVWRESPPPGLIAAAEQASVVNAARTRSTGDYHAAREELDQMIAAVRTVLWPATFPRSRP